MDEPYYVINLSKIKKSYDLWRQYLPEIEVYYAMKCNPDKIILEEMNKLGIKYDCASKQEIMDALEHTTADNIVYANPCKFPEHITYSKEQNVSLTVVDCECEMYKIAELYPSCRLLLRIAVNDENSQCAFSKKFGCKINEVKHLLELSKHLKINIVGFSFHVGSGCTNPSLYYDALFDCKTATIIATSLGIQVDIIDIGGGFNEINFIESAKQIQKGMIMFKDKKFISEVGRFLVEETQTLYLHVICKKKQGDRFIYYLNDGVYGSIGCKIFDHAKPIIKPVKISVDYTFDSTLYGPTCDSFDLIEENILLPELNIGDKLYIKNFGAYTNASASHFNGYHVTKKVYLNENHNFDVFDLE
uniref:ornithine decarboxylase n=1 Tax=viral metagenome TaxID=1070528 RepID=A0A6C0D220_9ZZZZ